LLVNVKTTTALVAAASVLLVACGGEKEAPKPPVEATPTAETVELAPLLVPADGLPGFRPTGADPVEQDDADAWAKTNDEPDSSQLKALEFVAGARQDLVGPPGAYGLNLVERFRTDEEAGERLSSTVRELSNAKGRFKVPGVPGAVGFESGKGADLGRSVAFQKGPTVFLLSHQVAKQTLSVARFKAAVRKWYTALPQ
jgi:hypothetical protein